jgi:hypothetical protein
MVRTGAASTFGYVCTLLGLLAMVIVAQYITSSKVEFSGESSTISFSLILGVELKLR